MIYNLGAYVVAQLPAIDFAINGWTKKSPENSVMLRQTGGDVIHHYDRSDYAVQFLSRAGSSVEAKEQIDAVFNLLKNKLGVALPEKVMEDATVYPKVQTYRIVPMQLPGYIGADDANLEMWSVNFIVTTD
ncbi:hypothetical protein ES705_38555 [subsurface metagenome]